MPRLAFRIVAFAALVIAGAAAAQTTSPVRLVAPYARATPPGAQVGAGYLTIVNDGASADRLIAVSTPDAQSVALHEVSMEGGVMRMRATNGLDVKPGQSVELKPGGHHLMFEKPRTPFKEGQSVKATLTFEKAGAIDVELPIGGLGASAPPAR